MKNYAVLEGMKRSQKTVLNCAFNKGYEQGYKDGKEDKEQEYATALHDIEDTYIKRQKAEYDRGFDEGYARGKLITTNDAYEAGYDKGYEKGKQESIEACKKCERTWQDGYSEGYDKGLQHGQELRIKETECAEACGMKRAWDVARKILSRHGEGYDATDMEVFGTDDVFSLSASEAVEKLEAWEKLDATKNDVKVGDNVRTTKDTDYAKVKLFPIGTLGVVTDIIIGANLPYKISANGKSWRYSRDMFEVVKDEDEL